MPESDEPIRSINNFKRKYFPKLFAKEERKRKIEKYGIGKVIADEVLKSFEEKLHASDPTNGGEKDKNNKNE